MADYALAMSDIEIRRYLSMAEQARESESELWALAGIDAGTTVADHVHPAIRRDRAQALTGPRADTDRLRPSNSGSSSPAR
jgi:hypothetical protein